MKPAELERIRKAITTVEFATDSLLPALREKHGTYRKVAKVLGVTFVHISNVKRGHSEASRQLLNLMVQDLMETP